MNGITQWKVFETDEQGQLYSLYKYKINDEELRSVKAIDFTWFLSLMSRNSYGKVSLKLTGAGEMNSSPFLYEKGKEYAAVDTIHGIHTFASEDDTKAYMRVAYEDGWHRNPIALRVVIPYGASVMEPAFIQQPGEINGKEVSLNVFAWSKIYIPYYYDTHIKE